MKINIIGVSCLACDLLGLLSVNLALQGWVVMEWFMWAGTVFMLVASPVIIWQMHQHKELIDEIKVFEAYPGRNYLTMLVSMLVVLWALSANLYMGLAYGVLTIYMGSNYMYNPGVVKGI